MATDTKKHVKQTMPKQRFTRKDGKMAFGSTVENFSDTKNSVPAWMLEIVLDGQAGQLREILAAHQKSMEYMQLSMTNALAEIVTQLVKEPVRQPSRQPALPLDRSYEKYHKAVESLAQNNTSQKTDFSIAIDADEEFRERIEKYRK